jgi:hypothetical protein
MCHVSEIPKGFRQCWTMMFCFSRATTWLYNSSWDICWEFGGISWRCCLVGAHHPRSRYDWTLIESSESMLSITLELCYIPLPVYLWCPSAEKDPGPAHTIIYPAKHPGSGLFIPIHPRLNITSLCNKKLQRCIHLSFFPS